MFVPSCRSVQTGLRNVCSLCEGVQSTGTRAIMNGPFSLAAVGAVLALN